MLDFLEAASTTAPYPIRRLHRLDGPRVAAFVAMLDDDTRQRRFDRFMSPAAVHAHYAALDWDRTTLLTWGIDHIRGLVEVHLFSTPARPVEAEIALVVAPTWCGRGIGQLLLASAAQTAEAQGAHRSTIMLAARDHALARIAQRLGFTIEPAANRAVLTHHDARGRL